MNNVYYPHPYDCPEWQKHTQVNVQEYQNLPEHIRVQNALEDNQQHQEYERDCWILEKCAEFETAIEAGYFPNYDE